MLCVGEVLRLRARPQAIALAMIAVGAAGCSSDSGRFNDSSSGPRPGEVTGSVTPAPVGRVETNQLPPPAPGSATTGFSGGGRGMASYTPGSSSPTDITGSVHPSPPPPATAPPPPPRKPAEQWSWDGGTAITVGRGDTIEAVARRHSVPASAIISANNLGPGGAVYPGQRLVIPRRQASAPPAASSPPVHATPTTPQRPTAVAPAPAPAPARPAPPAAHAPSAVPANAGVHVVGSGDTLHKIARLYNKSLLDILQANNLAPNAKLKLGDRIIVPGARTVATAPRTAPPAAATPAPSPPKSAGKQAMDQPVQGANVVSESAATPPVTNVNARGPEGATPLFRWPVKGRVIAGFGPRTNGQQNDGINLAVPEGTPVKAAEDGVVAYAGSELKGYGNLVLVRHSNGYVTAYAHAKELLVKRGDAIKRGQVIANSGQTGNVDAPQLHFEIRKGPAPVDPLPMLNGG